ncbi:hypothetical protein [Saccharomonospora xinjiangensis]|uniref:Uncharacterized protein n=1 Tax=Saccharomonospora xinjiangensis XJ-54 TaxID=882086 RepID=I0V3T5_9PSEU|nr:hypothetical protein [Saccharomonospora xinjiangensis]EID54788.1 hypothetical protein SacxiDRAFT_2566 [Saccharomonospora xinjiangensis XJ-54]
MAARGTVENVLFVVAAIGLVVGGIGFFQGVIADSAYEISFDDEGDTCNPAEMTHHVDADDGTLLHCRTASQYGLLAPASGPMRFAGFTSEQNAEITALIEKLAHNALIESEQELLRDRVNEIAATLPPHRRPDNFEWYEGWNLFWPGFGTLAVCACALRLLNAR